MKKIEAIIKPFKLDEVRDALENAGIENIVITDVRLFGQKSDKSSMYEEGEYVIDALPKIKLECLLEDQMVETIQKVITDVLESGRKGDGSITLYDVHNFVQL